MAEFLQIFSTLLFFLVYYKYNIYTASLCLSILSVVQVLAGYFFEKAKTSMNQSSLLMLALFGFATWYFGNPRFIQWKITIANIGFAMFIYGYRHFNKEAFFTSTFKSSNLIIPNQAGINADNMLAIFFVATGLLNVWIFSTYPESTWVLFKTSIIFINIAYLMIITAYLSQYVKPTASHEDN